MVRAKPIDVAPTRIESIDGIWGGLWGYKSSATRR